MLTTEKELRELEQYKGSSPMPEDFDAFWDARVEEARRAPLEYEKKDSEVSGCPHCEFQDLWFRGIDGELLYAKYVRPRCEGPVPLILQFHGYPGASRGWLEQSSFAALGYAVIAMDCPGQGGRSEDKGGYSGTTVSGHLIAGLDGEAKRMYYVRLHQSISILCRIVREFEELDSSRVYVNGGSQGGAQALICAALNTDLIQKAAILYPFLSDFQKVCALGADVVAYEGLRYYLRWFDATGERTEEIFTRLGYLDVQNFAHRVKAEVLFGTGMSDTVCPPITQYAVYNKLTCKKRHVLFENFGHEEIQDFDDMLISFFAEERNG